MNKVVKDRFHQEIPHGAIPECLDRHHRCHGRLSRACLGAARQSHVDRWDGGIDEIRISNVALDPSLFIASFSAADADGDGLPTAWETEHGLDPNDNGLNPNNNGVAGNPANGKDGDPDGDNYKNLAEFTAGSDPQLATSVPGDIDGDTLPDSWEIAHFTNLLQGVFGDPDNDYTYNDEEYAAGTDPMSRLSFPETETPPDGMGIAFFPQWLRDPQC